MKPAETRELTGDELKRKERDVKEELFNLEVQLSTRQTTNVSRVKKVKKDLARVLTVMRERELGIRRR
ncbi:MAG TPA: 50S ribosomal protein L29 [Thermodesulfobacteriota bacterium]|nr:50S ribosomal protein L29 [Thermodesulfobacteriota bacterium]